MSILLSPWPKFGISGIDTIVVKYGNFLGAFKQTLIEYAFNNTNCTASKPQFGWNLKSMQIIGVTRGDVNMIS